MISHRDLRRGLHVSKVSSQCEFRFSTLFISQFASSQNLRTWLWGKNIQLKLVTQMNNSSVRNTPHFQFCALRTYATKRTQCESCRGSLAGECNVKGVVVCFMRSFPVDSVVAATSARQPRVEKGVDFDLRSNVNLAGAWYNTSDGGRRRVRRVVLHLH